MNNNQSAVARPEKHKSLLGAAFNQDQSCFAVGYESGFRVYSSDPLEQKVRRDFTDGGVGIAQMLHRTNYLAIVGGGRTPKYPQNKIIIWDDIKHQPALSLEFLSPVLNVLLSRTRIVAVLKNKVHIYNFSSPPSRLTAYDTVDNPDGLVTLADDMLAFPSRTEGQVQLVKLSGSSNVEGSSNLVSIVKAHRNRIRCLALSHDGQILASASETGTIIRLHATSNTALLHEFRRGLDRAVIFSMAFSPSNQKLACLSDKNTLHVFDTAAFGSNKKHVLGKLPFMPRYFSSEWSFASARVSGDRGTIGWSSETTIIVLWTEEAKWEKYALVERTGSPSTNGEGEGESKWELVREGWRAFDI